MDSNVPSTILRSIFVQLLHQTDDNWLKEFMDLSRSKRRGKSPPTRMQDLVDLIRRASKLFPRTIIALDALDECQQTNASLPALLHSLKLIQMHGLSLFVTSRDEHNFQEAFNDLPSISLGSRETDCDIKIFAQAELKGHRRFYQQPENEREEIVQIIVKRTKGMYVLCSNLNL